MSYRESSHERLCQIVEEQERQIADLTRERDEARTVIERLLKAVDFAAHKLTCVELERGCSGVPEIVRVCDRQALGILREAVEKARQPCQ